MPRGKATLSDMVLTILVLVFTIVMFIAGRIRSDIVALCSLTFLMLCGVLTPSEALAGFSSTVVIMMIGLFVISGAILQTGLAKECSKRIMTLSRGNDTLMFVLVMITTATIGAFVSNTGTVALMMPIIVSMASQMGKSPSRLLMPLAFASSMGGMLTLIGTPPNLVINETLVDAGYESLSFFSFSPVGIIAIVVGILVLLPLSRLFLEKKGKDSDGGGSKRKSLDQLVEEYNLHDNMRAFRLLESSEIKGKSVAELDLRNRFGLSILEIRTLSNVQCAMSNEQCAMSNVQRAMSNVQWAMGRIIKNVRQKVASATTVLQADDIIFLTGRQESFDRFLSVNTVEEISKKGLDFYDIGIAEIVVMPTSRILGRRLKDTDIRNQHNINVIGIQRSGTYIFDNLADERMHVGDVLLVQGSWRNIGKLDSAGDWVVLGQPSEQKGKVTLDYKAPVASVIMILMICAMVFDFIPVESVTAVMAAGLLMVLAGCFRSVSDAYKTINWESVVLIAAMMPMSTALEKTGTSALVSQSLVEAFGAIGPTALLAGIYFTTSLMTMFISNTATAVLMAPIALSAAQQVGVSPYPFLFAVTLGASMCFASPFSTPPNVLVMKAGKYEFMDYVKVGLPRQIIIGVIMTFVLPLLFPF